MTCKPISLCCITACTLPSAKKRGRDAQILKTVWGSLRSEQGSNSSPKCKAWILQLPLLKAEVPHQHKARNQKPPHLTWGDHCPCSKQLFCFVSPFLLSPTVALWLRWHLAHRTRSHAAPGQSRSQSSSGLCLKGVLLPSPQRFPNKILYKRNKSGLLNYLCWWRWLRIFRYIQMTHNRMKKQQRAARWATARCDQQHFTQGAVRIGADISKTRSQLE